MMLSVINLILLSYYFCCYNHENLKEKVYKKIEILNYELRIIYLTVHPVFGFNKRYIYPQNEYTE